MGQYIKGKRCCQACRSYKTKRTDVVWYDESVEEKRECRACGTEFKNVFEIQEQVIE